MLDTLKRELQRPSHLYRGGPSYTVFFHHFPEPIPRNCFSRNCVVLMTNPG
jgi:hypothetical protein